MHEEIPDVTLATSSLFPESASNGHGLVTACLSSSIGMLQLVGEWGELFERSGRENVFISGEWMATWWRHWEGNHRLLIVTVRLSCGRLIAVAPFYIRRSALGPWGARALCFLANTQVASDHLNVLVDPAYQEPAIYAIVRLVDRYRDEWDYIELNDTEDESPVLWQLGQGFIRLGMTKRVLSACHNSVCPYVELPRSFGEFLASRSSNLRYNYRRYRRALESKGVQFVALQGVAEIQQGFGELVRLHRLRFAHLGKPSGFLAPTRLRFHTDVLSQIAAKGWARVFLLQVKGRAIAALYGFSIGKTFSFYQSGIDPVWAHMSPGLVMMGCSIEHAIRSGIGTFDLLRGDEGYKFQWATGVHHTQTVCFFDSRAKSQWGLAQVRIRNQGVQIKLLVGQAAAARWLYAHVVRRSEQMKRLVHRKVAVAQNRQDSRR